MAERETPANADRRQRPTNGWPVLRPGVSDYARLRRDGRAYVDKTGELARMLSTGEFLFLARPRRFGKTLMLSTIECMYQGDWPNIRDPFVEFAHSIARVSDELLFADTSWESALAGTSRRPVIRLDMSAVTGDNPAKMELSLKQHVAQHALHWYRRGLDPGIELMHLRDSMGYPHAPQVMLEQLIQSLKSQSGNPVVLVDEYDTPLLKLLGRDSVEVESFFKLFRDFYRLFKQCESDLHKVLITGITRRAYGEIFSALNNLLDCTWMEEFGGVCGFTENDLDQAPLSTSIAAAAAGLGMSIGELREHLRENYHGYRFDPDGFGPSVYNPWSLCNVLKDLSSPHGQARIQRRGFPAHWSDSGVSKVLVDALRRQPDVVDPVPFHDPNELDADFYSNRATGLKSLMLQSGYLTHHPARHGQPTRLGWPTREIARTVLRDLARAHVGDELPGIDRLRICLESGNYRELPSALLDCLYAFPYNIMDDEYSYHAALHGIFLGMRMVPRSERRELSGRYDLAVICRGRASVIELKYNRSLKEAQDQADRRQYGRSLLMELDMAESAACIALHVTKTKDGHVGIEGAQRPVQDVEARWIPLGPANH